MTAEQIEYIKNIAERIESALYGTNQFNRQAKANLYDSILNAPSFFPVKTGFTKADASFLRRDVCSSCPSKVKPEKMKDHEAIVGLKFRSYLSKLRAVVLEFEGSKPSGDVSVHELDSNL